MKLTYSDFCLPKAGSSAGECEDAFFTQFPSSGDGWLATFAIADGATESILSGQWANILVRQFCKRDRGLPSIDERLLQQAYKVWDRWKRLYLLRRVERGIPIQWYEEPGLEVGAFSTLTGLTLLSDPFRWIGTAIGDSCLFQVRGGHLRISFPIRHSMDFGHRPELICSEPSRNADMLDGVHRDGGYLREGDHFYLMSDALAGWFLRQHEAGHHPWKELARFQSRSDQVVFEEWVTGLRHEARVRNDDVVLVMIATD